MKPVLAEIFKLRGSTSWAVVALLPVVSVVSACIFVRPDGWRLLWIRSVGFYGMALLPVGLAVLNFSLFILLLFYIQIRD